MEKRSIVDSFNTSIQGLLYALKTQRNLRVHFVFAFVFLVAGLLFLDRISFLILVLAVAFVLLTELINTTLEIVVDLAEERFHRLAQIAKDVAAGAVMVASLNAVVVGYILFVRPGVITKLENGLVRLRGSPWYLSFLVLMIVLVSTIVIKVSAHRGKPLSGGMPSGHSAVAFAVWTLVVFFSQNMPVIGLTFVMAIMIAHSRIVVGLHDIWEVLSGSALGISLTVFLLKACGLGI